jgi:hypothetical protein
MGGQSSKSKADAKKDEGITDQDRAVLDLKVNDDDNIHHDDLPLTLPLFSFLTRSSHHRIQGTG